MPKTPEEWLTVTSPPQKTKGSLKLFLGYAPGVGKTYSMLSEAIRRHSRGEDVVIGVVETHGRKGIAELVPQLEVIPRRKIDYKGHGLRGDGRRRRPEKAPRSGARRRTGPHEHSRQQAPQAIRRRARTPGSEDRRAFHRQHPAHRKHRAHRERHHRRRGARNRAGLGAAPLGRNRDGRSDARSPAKPHEARRRVSHGKSRAGAEEFLPPREPDRLARARAAAGGRTGGSQPFVLHG